MRVLVTGSGGQVGTEILHELGRRAEEIAKGPRLEIIAADHARLDVGDRDAVLGAIVTIEPDVVIHAAAFTAVDRCEHEPGRAFRDNALETRYVAEGARLVGAHVAYVSTDYVFDGRAPDPYTEWDAPNPLSVYGRSKLGGEHELDGTSTIVRTSWVCGRHGPNMVKTVLRLLREPGPLRFVEDQLGSPTIAGDLAGVLVELALARRSGVFHVTNSGVTSWFGFAAAVVGFAGGDVGRVEPITTAELVPPRAAPRPANSVLDNLALRLEGREPLRSWEDATQELVAELTS